MAVRQQHLRDSIRICKTHPSVDVLRCETAHKGIVPSEDSYCAVHVGIDARATSTRKTESSTRNGKFKPRVSRTKRKSAARSCVADRKTFTFGRLAARPRDNCSLLGRLLGSRFVTVLPPPKPVETYERPKRRYILGKHAGRDVRAFQRGLLHPPPGWRTAPPDDRQGAAEFARTKLLPRTQHLGSAPPGSTIADRRRKKTNNKTNNVRLEMVAGTKWTSR